MALVLNDRVKETTTTTGTSTVDLAGAETGFESFVAGIGNSNTTYYAIVHQTADEFEVGLGTVTDASPDTLSRTTIISSSNSDSAVNFSSGTKDVFCTLPASKAVFFDDSSGSSDVAIGSRGTNPMGLGIVGTVLSLTEQTNVASLQMDGNQASRIDMGSGPGTRQFVIYTDTANYSSLERKDAKPIVFATDNTERFRIDAAGGITTGGLASAARTPLHIHRDSSSDVQIHMTNTATGSTGSDGMTIFANSTTAGFWLRENSPLQFATNGTERMRLDTSGNLVCTGNVTAYGSVSDEKLKENIEVIDDAINKVKKLKGVTYILKSNGKKLTGLIAQDLEKVLPEAVYKTIDIDLNGDPEDEHLAIHYGNTVGLLVEAIKEQQEQIETLTAKVKELEDK
tara:strand:+ start:13061 stop:14254 length:1194 start_codon:yes stop_codon:yes gene_type:complete